MEEYKNTWGLYPWFPERGEHLIHPTQRQDIPTNSYYGRVFYCSGTSDDGYLILHFINRDYLVKPDLYRVVPDPKFNFGDWVKFIKASNIVIGMILGIGWHFRENRECYTLTMNDRKLKKRYWAEDLELIQL